MKDDNNIANQNPPPQISKNNAQEKRPYPPQTANLQSGAQGKKSPAVRRERIVLVIVLSISAVVIAAAFMVGFLFYSGVFDDIFDNTSSVQERRSSRRSEKSEKDDSQEDNADSDGKSGGILDTLSKPKTWTDNNGTTYTGKRLDGKINGEGKAEYKNGDVYEGQWADGVKEGEGTYTQYDSDGSVLSVYEGEFSAGVMSGRGVSTTYNSDGSVLMVYEGQFADDDMNGTGVLTMYSQDGGRWVCDGEFKDGTPVDGRCTVTMYDSSGRVVDSAASSRQVNPFIVNPQPAPSYRSQQSGTSYGSEYILPDSDKRYLTRSDLVSLTDEELRIARNEIYARHGRKFNDSSLQNYFNSCSWYVGTVEPDDFNTSWFNDYEMKNKDFILSYEEERKK